MNKLLLSAAHKSSGKTTISLGLCAALRGRGLTVQPFKKGPDYIDPMWLSLASGRACYNLDFYIMGHDEILRTLVSRSQNADICIIEGNKGLYDGLDLDGSNSNAALARLLNTPVILVIDARGMTRGIAPLILGYQAFDPKVQIGGVILNQLGGSRHEAKLRAVIEHYTDVRVIGAVPHDVRLNIVERHLGLTPSFETKQSNNCIEVIAEVIRDHVDLGQVIGLAETSGPIITPALNTTSKNVLRPDVRIGIARDAAFTFYYPDDLEALHAAGADLIPVNTLHDDRLPSIDALFIGGGFPETHMGALQANASLRRNIRLAIDNGLPVYAECGGLMYLSRSIRYRDVTCEMVGAIAADTVMHDKPQGRGYVLLRDTGNGLWSPHATETKNEIRAHEFHYSSLENIAPETMYAYEVTRGHGVDGRHDGIIYRNALACYTHMRNVGTNLWAEHFVQFVRLQKKMAKKTTASA